MLLREDVFPEVFTEIGATESKRLKCAQRRRLYIYYMRQWVDLGPGN